MAVLHHDAPLLYHTAEQLAYKQALTVQFQVPYRPSRTRQPAMVLPWRPGMLRLPPSMELSRGPAMSTWRFMAGRTSCWCQVLTILESSGSYEKDSDN